MQISFGRAIKVNTNLPLADNIFNKVNPAVRDIFDIIEGQNSQFFNEEQTNIIKNFLRTQIGDYSDDIGIIYRTINQDTFLFTGMDVLKVKNIEERTRKLLNDKKTFQAKKETRENKNKTLLDMIEDGMGYQKKYIELFIASKNKQNVSQLLVYKWPYEDSPYDDSVSGVSVLDLEI